ncbi:MAG: zinc-ribbon domain-containing protein [Halolamina sp.]
MSKITFRADDDLVDRLEAFDASKSEVMREALRAYLDAHGPEGDADGAEMDADGASDDPLGDALARRVDQLVERKLATTSTGDLRPPRPPARDLNLNVTVDGVAAEAADEEATVERDGPGRRTDRADPERNTNDNAGEHAGGERSCSQCGEALEDGAVYCSNCGEKATHRAFCECGDEVRTDWAFCPSCGRRTPAADVLDGP